MDDWPETMVFQLVSDSFGKVGGELFGNASSFLFDCGQIYDESRGHGCHSIGFIECVPSAFSLLPFAVCK